MTKRITEVKNGRNWTVTDINTDEAYIYKCLSKELIAKKLNGCTWIKSIRNTYNYDGTRTVVVDYGNGTRCVYEIEA